MAGRDYPHATWKRKQQIFRKTQEEKNLPVRGNSGSSFCVKKMRFFLANFKLETMSALAFFGPEPTPADQIMGASLKVKVCLTASWLGPLDQSAEARSRSRTGSGRDRDIEILGTEAKNDGTSSEIGYSGQSGQAYD